MSSSQAAFPAMMLIAAMRTAMPKVTCDRITLCLPFATAESISTPRLRPRVHHDSVRLSPLQPLWRQAKALEKLLAGRQQRTVHTLALQTQHDDDISAFDALCKRVTNAHSHRSHVRRHQRFRPHHPHLGTTERVEGMNIRARHA